MKLTVHELEKRVKARGKKRGKGDAASSYTRQLLDRGVAQCAKKLGEEAVETVLAAVNQSRGRLIAESADLIYHLLVVLAARRVTLAQVETELGKRSRQSGLEEKAARRAGKKRRRRKASRKV